MFQQFLVTIKAANTRETYGRGLGYFADWAGDNGVDLTALRVRDIKAFRDFLGDRLGAASTNVYLSALRAFLRWAADEELIQPAVYQATTVVKNVKVPERLPQVLRAEEVSELLCQPDPATLSGARDLAFIAILVTSGIRVSEAAGLDLERIDIYNRTARVIGKGDKERVVRFTTKTAQALAHYLRLRNNGATTGPVFTNRSGTRISVRYMQERVGGYGFTLASGERLHPHTLRHTFATMYLDATGDIDGTRRWLGHESTATTQVYTKLANSRLNAQYDGVMEDRPEENTSLDLVLDLAPARVFEGRK